MSSGKNSFNLSSSLLTCLKENINLLITSKFSLLVKYQLSKMTKFPYLLSFLHFYAIHLSIIVSFLY
ncbi:Regulator of Ty1 transposition protein 10 [Bienertia sinuspersici]